MKWFPKWETISFVIVKKISLVMVRTMDRKQKIQLQQCFPKFSFYGTYEKR